MPNTVIHKDWQADIGELAPREAQYLLGFVQGLTGKEVAREFGVSPNTVKKASVRILCKLDAWRMTEAIAKAAAMGLIRPMCMALAVLMAQPAITETQSTRPVRVAQTTRIQIREFTFITA